MAEVAAEPTHLRHHPQNIALVFAAMRKFAAPLATRGWRLAYTRLDDPPPKTEAPSRPNSCAAQPRPVLPRSSPPLDGWRLMAALEGVPLRMLIPEDNHFLFSPCEFAA